MMIAPSCRNISACIDFSHTGQIDFYVRHILEKLEIDISGILGRLEPKYPESLQLVWLDSVIQIAWLLELFEINGGTTNLTCKKIENV